MAVQYIGEHLFPGELGKVFIWMGFIAAMMAAIFYFWFFYRPKAQNFLLRSARFFYLIHLLSLILVSVVLYYLIWNHHFEYAYVWEYSSMDLPVQYIISCFWAGQEGSLLFWALSQAIVGMVLLKVSRNWESPLMVVFSISQAFITALLLGIRIFGFPIGASPFMLIRETIDTVEGTIFAMPDYLTKISDGNGLNPMLENFWMTIHPPVLFIGYALTLVPFAYAIASFLKKDMYTWVSRAFPWALLGLLMLGSGILLGGAWAYVSLTFGGFWSWDPVENASLVPWLTLLAAIHFMLISRRQNFALFAAYLFTTLSYVLVLYASFLTRSGILAETSAHSFGSNGLTVQLLLYLVLFFGWMTIMIGIHIRKFLFLKTDVLLSREFWMLIGGIILVLAAFQIIFTTSIPVFNALFHTQIAPPSDRVGFYNRWQMPYAILIAGFIAMSQLLNYGLNTSRKFLQKLFPPLIASILSTIPFIINGMVTQVNYILFLYFIFFALFSSIGNFFYKNSHHTNWPAIVTHLGFAFFLLGVLLTFSNSSTISANTSRFDLGDLKTNRENLMLMRGDTLYMDGFNVVYSGNQKQGNTTFYRVDFLKKKMGKYTPEFFLLPSVNVHPRMGAVHNPDTRHFILRDYYIYVSAVGNNPDYIVIRAIMNPYINVLWAGGILMMVGMGWAFSRRAHRRWVMR